MYCRPMCMHTYIRVFCIAHINSIESLITMRFGRQTTKFSEIVWKCQMTVPAVVVLVEGRSTGEDRWLRSFCHPVCCVCAVRADSAIRWNPTAAGDGRHPTAGSSHQRGTQGSLQKVTGGRVLRPWTRSVVGLAASAVAAAPVWCGRADERLRPGAQQRSAPTASGGVVLVIQMD